MDATELLCPGDRVRPVRGLIAKKKCTFARNDGSVFPGELSGKTVNHPDGRPAFVVVSVWDMSETERRMMKQKAASMAIIGGGLAHDINNLLTSLLGNMEIAKTYLPSQEGSDDKVKLQPGNPGKVAKYINSSMDVVMEIRALAFRFADIAGYMVSKEECVELEPALGHLQDKMKKTADENHVNLEFAAGKDCAFLGDPIKSGEMLESFAVNGIEAMAESGGTLKITAWKKDKTVTIEISDTGRGIDEKAIGKIFDPYFSTKDRGTQKGMGLSLAVAHSLISMFGGDVGVRSTKGNGTVFTIHLPAAGQEDRNI
jgi:signal transduction histidine kinase